MISTPIRLFFIRLHTINSTAIPMTLLRHIQYFLLIFLMLKSIVCQRHFKEQNEKANLMLKLLNVVKKTNLENKSLMQLKKNSNRIVKKDLKDIFDKGIVVKRLVPHNSPIKQYEYDAKSNTLYRPLIRLHGRKRRVNFKGEKIYGETPVKSPQSHVRKVIFTDDELLQPFRFSNHKKVTFRTILDDVSTYIGQAKTASEIRRLKYAVLELLENYPKTLLRHKFSTASDERAYETLLTFNEEGVTEKPKKKWLPEYPFWNYWNYEKTIYQDKCKGKLIQLGNLCVETPPH